jgi:ankyrin repeat protein
VPIVASVANREDKKQTCEIILKDRTDGREIGRKSVMLAASGQTEMDEVADLILTGEPKPNQYFGDWLADGDVNGDGYPDLLVSSSQNRTEKAGKAYLYYGGVDMDSIADKTFIGENQGDYFSDGGGYLADMNNDGFDDVIIGSRFFSNRGRVYLFFGGPDMDEKADIIFEPEETVMYSSFGRGMAVGDLNGDGYKDLIVSAPGSSHPESKDLKGRTYLFYGGDPIDTTIDRIFIGENANDGFGAVRSARGDVDGDGFDDLIIGTRYYPDFADNHRGRAYLYYGAPDTDMDTVCDLIFDSENDKDQFATGVDLFDVDNDGHADIIISARTYSGGQGRTYIYWGSSRKTMDNVADVTLTGEADAGSVFGGDHVLAGYVNNDEYADIIVTAWNYYQGSHHGKVYLFYGGTKSTIDNIFDRAFTGDKPGSWIMSARMADFNGDGCKDIAVGGWGYPNTTKQGRVWLYYGTQPFSTGVKFSWDTGNASMGYHDLRVKVDPVVGGQDTQNDTKKTVVEVISDSMDQRPEVGEEKLQKSLAKSTEPRGAGLLSTEKPTSSFTRAAVNGNVEQIRSQLAIGTDINERTISGDTALHYAIKYRHKNVAKLLIAEGADVRRPNRDGETLTHLAIKTDQRDILDLLIAKGAIISPEHLAAYKGDTDRVKRFIKGKMSVNATDGGGLTLLHAAASGGQRNVAEYLIGQEAEVNACDKKRQTPLFCAAAAGHKDVVELLIARGAELNPQREPDRWTPLCVAVHGGHKDVVELLLAKEAGIDAGKFHIGTTLHYAAEKGHKEIAELLIAHGADVNAKRGGYPIGDTPLHSAARAGHKEIVKLLIANGADINAKNENGQTPVDIGVSRNRKEIVDLLIANGADVSLHTAAYYGLLEKLKELIGNGSNVNAKNNADKTALDVAIQEYRQDIVKLLVDKGADVSVHAAAFIGDINRLKAFVEDGSLIDKADADGQTPLHYAAAGNHRDIAEFLISKGAKVNAVAGKWKTPLGVAARTGSVDVAEYLIAQGANVNSGEGNWTPLQEAAYYSKEMVELLLAKGANINAPGWSPLHSALDAERFDIVELLLAKGADVNIKDGKGRTPLHIAAWYAAHDNSKIVELLLSKGADINAKDDSGKTALAYAMEGGYGEIVKLLQEQMSSHDITITDVSVPSTCVQGDTASVTISVANKGAYKETFRVILNDQTSNEEIASEEVTLVKAREDRLGDDADVIFDSPASGKQYFGYPVICGDVNGDDYNDLLVGASQWNNTQGRAYLYYGGRNMDTIPDKTFTGEGTGDWFGDGGASLGDVNGDNYDDVVVGASNYRGSAKDGRVYIFYGGPDMDEHADLILKGESGGGGYYGATIATGDVNNDSYCDVVVTAIFMNSQRGRAYLYYGGDPMDATCDLTFDGENTNDWFGRKAAIGGDVNGDGYSDLIIGARRYPGGKEKGRAYLFYGGNPMNHICDKIFTGMSDKDRFGEAVHITDVDNDGFGDVAIGAWGYNGGSSQGRVYLYWGEADIDPTVADKTFTGMSGNVRTAFGGFIWGGNINNDNYKDLLIVGFNYYRGDQRGQAYIYYGGTKENMNEVADNTFTGVDQNSFWCRVALGDVNNDCYDDAIIGGWKYNNDQGRVWLYYGDPGDSTQLKFDWDTSTASSGKHILKATIDPVQREEDTVDNTMTVTVEVKEPSK